MYNSVVENMTEEYPSLSSHKSRSWSEWINCVENSDLCMLMAVSNLTVLPWLIFAVLGNGNQEEYGNTLLPRQDITLYGIYPKMESRVFVMCKECSKVIRSNGIKSHLLHCHTNKKIEEQASIDISGSSNAIKKKSSHSKSKKKCVLPKNVPLSPLFPVCITKLNFFFVLLKILVMGIIKYKNRVVLFSVTYLLVF